MKTPSKLTARLERLTAQERITLQTRLNDMSPSTWSRRLEDAKSWTGEELTTIHNFLLQVDGMDYDMLEMLKDVELPTRNAARA